MVVGHRGVPTLHQENSLAGFRRAVSLGIDAVELDVQLTQDGRAVVCHDADLRRLTGERLRVSEISWSRLAKLRVRSQLPMGIDSNGTTVVIDYDHEESIPLLAEVFTEVGGALAINVEMKLDASSWWRTDIGRVVADEIAAAGLEDRVIVTSFDLRKLRAAKRANQRLSVGFCFDDSMLDGLKPLLSRSRAVAVLRRALTSNVVGHFLDAEHVGADHTLISERIMQAVRRRGLAIGTHTLFPIGSTTGKLIPITASEAREVERLVELGVDWIESDDPERVLALVA